MTGVEERELDNSLSRDMISFKAELIRKHPRPTLNCLAFVLLALTYWLKMD